jgi:uncharacterized protein YecE (DUF72 family)
MDVNLPYLQQWVKLLAEWYYAGKTLYVFCHCPYEEHSPAICAQLHALLSEHIPLEPLPSIIETEASSDSGPQQMSLF